MTATDPDLTLRQATVEDAPQVGRVHTATRLAAVPLMPPALHTAEEDVAHFAGVVADADREVWVAESGGEIAGFLTLTPTWIDDLFVHPDRQGEGIGTALVELAQALRPAGLGLHVFETNTPARDLYRRLGFVEVNRSDGSENEERAPDVRMDWRGPAS
ncbi:MAG TPA: GNAT family N-acetyltransferase [Nocardioides sp.]|nr:GNAT family N-acetyltransferase [Nocardioides sp.]